MTHRTFDDPTSIEARQHLLDNRSGRAHPKRHRTTKRKSRALVAKRAAGTHIAAMQLVAKRRRLASARAYWSGTVTIGLTLAGLATLGGMMAHGFHWV